MGDPSPVFQWERGANARTEITDETDPRSAEASAADLSKRKIAASLGISATAAGQCIRRARGAAGLTWPRPEGVIDDALEARPYPPPAAAKAGRPKPDWPVIYRELRRPGVTLLTVVGGVSRRLPRWICCELYRGWESRLKPTMRQNHVAGERLFVDYAGTTLEVINELTGEVIVFLPLVSVASE